MKKKKIFIIVLIAVTFWAISLVPPSVAIASDGGAVQTNGVISFYDEDSSTSQSSSLISNSNVSKLIEKPKGRFPSTGELVKKSMSLSGLILLIIALAFFFWTRNKSKKGDETQ